MEVCASLVAEHDVILHVLDALEKEAGTVDGGAPVRREFFASAIAFVREFADGVHHKKEEGILFPRMAEAGVPHEGGPIGVMLYEHDEGRTHIRAMDSALAKAADGDAPSRQILVRETRGYVALLRAHIMKENMILFPMADRVFDPGQRSLVLEAFTQAEAADAEITAKRRQWAEGLP
ncbi:MAG: hemerythrin domain-containing protein [candidate division Zixibacteria bacterium]|nr:hemerythrin domain-containing protein [candidate division Zixibacteria bacterium]